MYLWQRLTDNSSLGNKNSGLVAIMATTFLWQLVYIFIFLYFLRRYVLLEIKTRWRIFAFKTINIRKEVNPSFVLLYWFSHIGKLPNGWQNFRSPYNTLQTLVHCVYCTAWIFVSNCINRHNIYEISSQRTLGNSFFYRCYALGPFLNKIPTGQFWALDSDSLNHIWWATLKAFTVPVLAKYSTSQESSYNALHALQYAFSTL